MPIICIKVNIEKDLENGSYKHFLNHEDFDVYSIKEDSEMFSMVQKKSNWKCGKCDQERMIKEGIVVPDLLPEHFRTCPKRKPIKKS